MSLSIRIANPDDLLAILAIYNDAVLHTTASYDEEPSTLVARRAWYDAHIQLGLPIVVAESADHVVGWGSLSQYRARIGYRFTIEHSVYVAADWRGQGVGRRLLGELIQHAQALGMHTMLGVIDAENSVSLRLHSNFGFNKVAHLQQVGFKFGRWLDVVIMQLILGDHS